MSVCCVADCVLRGRWCDNAPVLGHACTEGQPPEVSVLQRPLKSHRETAIGQS